ncbi:hypothetical protein EVAR_59938_1 [Eumeta japonica]|uniref:Uncharacterized protein n=1 Tax=Eumeta variegata TaxID=151549 RepID=A0A4C1ZGV3_EUMVA|nr:hypothetical protein EVAR_59938_1 [Eumeta japonica]
MKAFRMKAMNWMSNCKASSESGLMIRQRLRFLMVPSKICDGASRAYNRSCRSRCTTSSMQSSARSAGRCESSPPVFVGRGETSLINGWSETENSSRRVGNSLRRLHR